VLSDWKRGIGEGQLVGVVFLDLKKAFEMVDRRILIRKLQKYGLKGSMLEYFRNYLENRTQIKFNDILSKPIDVNMGVTQGSI